MCSITDEDHVGPCTPDVMLTERDRSLLDLLYIMGNGYTKPREGRTDHECPGQAAGPLW